MKGRVHMKSFSDIYEVTTNRNMIYPSWMKEEKYFNCDNYYQTMILGKVKEKTKKVETVKH